MQGNSLKLISLTDKDDVNELSDEISFDKYKRGVMKMIKKSLYLLTLSVLFCTVSVNRVFSQDIPERPVPPRLVNDFAGMLKAEEVSMLEQKLVAFNDSTSTQIAIVIVPTLDGYDKADYAQRLG